MFDGDLLAERARVTPDKLALVVVETGERLTYAQLNERTERAADTLRALLQPGDRFGILAYNSVEFLELFFAAGKAGVIAVPLSTRATEHELRHIATDCDMRVLFHGPGFETMDVGIERHATNWRHSTSNQQPVTTHAEGVYCLLYTSGTTGKPKGVMIPKRQLYWNGYNTAVNWGLREDDVSPIFTPLYHAGGIAAFLIPIFCMGGTIVLHKSFDPAQVWRTIEGERCTVVLGVPTIWKLLMDAPEFSAVDLSHARWFISGGAPLPQFIIDAYQKRGVVFKQGYGMTEVGVNCFTMTVEESFRKPGSIGRPMLFTEVKLVDDGGQAILPVTLDRQDCLSSTSDVGEMYIKGPHVSLGYWNNEEATRAAYGEDGWFRTGDLARRDEDGFFYIAGRRKEMFISGGVNVYPAEIEAELVSHPAVADAAVIAVPDDTWGEVGIAFVVGSVTEEELAQYLSLRIAKYKLPRRFVFIDALPRTPYGKVVKEELRKRLS
jgi:fatty-acyl-CoA synthase